MTYIVLECDLCATEIRFRTRDLADALDGAAQKGWGPVEGMDAYLCPSCREAMRDFPKEGSDGNDNETV